MANVLITYDVSDKNKEVKDSLKAKGYSDNWTSDKVKYSLPNTTLWKSESTAETGKVDMEAVAKINRVVLESAMAVEFTSWKGISGTPHI